MVISKQDLLDNIASLYDGFSETIEDVVDEETIEDLLPVDYSEEDEISGDINKDTREYGITIKSAIDDQATQLFEDMLDKTVRSNFGSTVDISTNLTAYQNDIEWVASQDVSTDQYGAYAWDPRLQRVDAFLLNTETGSAPILVPFASNTIASAFFDESFVIERAISNAWRTGDKDGDSSAIYTNTKTGANNSISTKSSSATGTASDKTMVDDQYNDQMLQMPENYGVASLMNPYTLTKLSGGLTDEYQDAERWHNRMYDIRDRKRFYDQSISSSNDTFNINNPTTSNIITWSNHDKWGRTPYSFQDFVFCKYWNIIPNNRLITLRKYHAPTYDNLKFEHMLDDNGGQTPMFSPIATVVTYFGDETGNSLSGLMSFSAGVNWKEIKSAIHEVTGDTGTDPRAVIDNMFTQGGFGGVIGENTMIQNILSKSGFWSGKYLSYGKFSGLLDPDGYNIGKEQGAFEVLNAGLRDPSDQLYANKIQGPVNRIDSTMAREAGITFDQSLSITCEYVARPIGGVNVKAAILDILSNCLEIGAVDAMWWGGGYRFMIHPQMYPFKRDHGTNTYMKDLYDGKIFGSNGALAHLVDGVKKFGSTDKDGNPTGSFEWSNVTSKLGEFLGESLGAIGSLLQSISSTILGSNSTLSQWLETATDTLSTEEQQEAGKTKMNNLFKNINDMWRSQVIQKSVMPSINNMKALLSGEPVGNWHLTVGNPLNPIMVIGNLICENMKVEFNEELGPDDFPLEMKVTYQLKHGMPRDKSSIESMFNKGAGRTYVLPDFMRATSDYESKVDEYTGPARNAEGNIIDGYYVPQYMQSSAIMAEAQQNGAQLGYYNVQYSKPQAMQNQGNPDTTFITKFSPLSVNLANSQVLFNNETKSYLNQNLNRSLIKGHGGTRKLMN